MRWMKWAGFMAGCLLIVSCFLTWVIVVSKNIVITGIDTTGTSFGKPGYLHIIFAGLFILLNLTPKIWAKRINLLIAAFNLAWAARNYFIISACQGGDCPEKHNGIYLLLVSSILMMVAALFPDIKLPAEKSRD